MYKLDLEKAEEPEVKLLISVGSWKKQDSSRKTLTFALLTMPRPLTVWITTNWKILQEMGLPNHLTCLLRNLYAGFQIRKGVLQGCILGTGAYLTHLCPTLCNCPSPCQPANPLNHACLCIKTL